MRYSDRADTIRAAARGQWRQIHAALGIPPETLTDRHQPCPCCGGRDRFRYDDKDGSGSFICSHFANGGGDGFHLVEHYLDCDFPAALRAVAGILGMGEGGIHRPAPESSCKPFCAVQRPKRQDCPPVDGKLPHRPA
nr:primase-helicase zinc-binding domain-containing protein [uncultured Cardiobacterium sp.]